MARHRALSRRRPGRCRWWSRRISGTPTARPIRWPRQSA